MKLTHDKCYVSGPNVVYEKLCSVTGRVYRVEVEIGKNGRWRNGELIQDVFPEMSREDREFLISSCTPAEFKSIFGEEE